jgi:hypothetical protein
MGMSELALGDLVVLTAGSMRMAVEGVDGEQVACVWCHEGEIGRDVFHTKLLKKWEVRDEDRSERPARSGAGAGKPYRGDREGGGKRFEDRPARSDDDKPRGKPGWDGKPREKKFFRKD